MPGSRRLLCVSKGVILRFSDPAMVPSAGAAAPRAEPVVGVASMSGAPPANFRYGPSTRWRFRSSYVRLFSRRITVRVMARRLPPDDLFFGPVAQAGCFASLAFVLLYFGRRDRRARSLGLFVLDAASNFTTPALQTIAQPSILTSAALSLRTDAFQAALLWYFFRPSRDRPPMRRWGERRYIHDRRICARRVAREP